jgi:ABC-type uncharacterized transport system permease subunit
LSELTDADSPESTVAALSHLAFCALIALALIVALASIVMWLSGYDLENRGIHLKYQANTIKHRRVLSLLTLAENVLRYSPLIFTITSLEYSLDTLRRRYNDMVLVY